VPGILAAAGARSSSRPDYDRVVIRLLEREEELRTLAQAVDRAQEGVGTVVLVGGEAGAGKTSLVRALREQRGEQVSFLIGACEPLSVPVPLGPMRELFEAASGEDLVQEGRDDRLALGRALLAALAEHAPVVAVIEDAHWADPLTLDVLRVMARRVEEVGVALVVTYRDDEIEAHPALGLLLGDLTSSPVVRRVALGPLSESAVRNLTGSAGLDAAVLARITGGNPFLVVESIAAGLRLPASVRDAALARVGRLSAAGRQAVDVAAVIGQRFDIALLQAVAPVDAEAVAEAQARGVLVEEGRALGFRHELIREAIEASISAQRRAELHGRVLHALAAGESSADHARLAHHAELAGLTADACRYARLALEDAERVGALHEVWLQAGRALRLGDGLDARDRLELLIRYARAANFSNPELEDGVSAAERALALAQDLGDRVALARAASTLAWTLWSTERVNEARAAAERAVAVLDPELDVAELARAYATLARMEATAFEPARAIEAGASALHFAGLAGLTDLPIDVSISVGLARGHMGQPQALEILSEALAGAKREGLTIETVRTYVNLMSVGVALRDHARVDAVMLEALPHLEAFHTPIPARAIEFFRARSLLDRGLWELARAIAARCDETLPGEIPVALAIEGLLRARAGDPDSGRLLEQAWEEIWRRVAAESARHGMIRLALVEAAWLRDDRKAALAALHAARTSPAVARFARSGSELALWGRRLGVELELPEGAPAPVRLELAGDWRGAIAAWRALEAPYEAALAALPGDERAAREAVATLQRLGAGAAARAFGRERAARGASAARGPRRSTLAHPAGLTRREQEVLEQLASGATNAAIAQALHLSERTVSHHVAAILRKLAAPNRWAAVEKARATGLLAKDRPPSSER
jgi:DNA-binding CsgD family transcriptional regulator/tetratricopeptide (TPR) repeat protein